MHRVYIYELKTGRMYDFVDGARIAYRTVCDSGRAFARNSPVDIPDAELGPIPVGNYWVGQSRNHPTLGAFVLPLIAWPGNRSWGRHGFYVCGPQEAARKAHAGRGAIHADRVFRECLDRLVRDQVKVQIVVVDGEGTLEPF